MRIHNQRSQVMRSLFVSVVAVLVPFTAYAGDVNETVKIKLKDGKVAELEFVVKADGSDLDAVTRQKVALLREAQGFNFMAQFNAAKGEIVGAVKASEDNVVRAIGTSEKVVTDKVTAAGEAVTEAIGVSEGRVVSTVKDEGKSVRRELEKLSLKIADLKAKLEELAKTSVQKAVVEKILEKAKVIETKANEAAAGAVDVQKGVNELRNLIEKLEEAVKKLQPTTTTTSQQTQAQRRPCTLLGTILPKN